MKQVILPKKPSKLLKLAMADLEACEADPHYTIDMGVWLRKNGTCAVCMAGAVMAQRLDGERVQPSIGEACPDAYPDDFRGNSLQLNALDLFRCGEIRTGLSALGVGVTDARAVNVKDAFEGMWSGWPVYAESPTEWKHTMATLIGVLEAEGL